MQRRAVEIASAIRKAGNQASAWAAYPPKTFGSKVRAWIKEDPTAKRFESLIPARNLVAHAFIQCIEFKGVTSALWEIADGTGDLNCKKLDDVALNDWARQLLSLIDEAIVAAEAMKKR